MPHPRYTSSEIVRRGRELYEERIRDRLGASDRGQFLAVDIETREFELDADELAALSRANEKNPGGALCILRVGHPTTYRLGHPGRGERNQPARARRGCQWAPRSRSSNS